MIAYELYWFDKTAKAHFIGVLKEKREKRKSTKNNKGICPYKEGIQ